MESREEGYSTHSWRLSCFISEVGGNVGPDNTMEIKTLQGVQTRTGIGRGRGPGISYCNNFIGWAALSP